jgi:hypothetical protein
MVPSMLPVAPTYGGRCPGFTKAATLAEGKGVAFAGELEVGFGCGA